MLIVFKALKNSTNYNIQLKDYISNKSIVLLVNRVFTFSLLRLGF